MRTIAKITSCIALGVVILPPLLYLKGSMDLPAVKTWMLAATAVWFAATPLWMDRKTT